MRSLVAEGKSIIFISHKLQEVVAVADRITVLRKGKVTAEGLPITGLAKRELAQLMVGRNVVFMIEKEPNVPGDVLLEVRDSARSTTRAHQLCAVSRLTCTPEKSWGLPAWQATDKVNWPSASPVCAIVRPAASRSTAKNSAINHRSWVSWPAFRHIPEDRNRVGSSPNLSITDNVIMKTYRHKPIGNGVTINAGAAQEYAHDLKASYDILAPSIQTMARKLSGGNLQKVILAREITADPKVIVAVQPTRGLDVGAVEAVQHHLLRQRKAGTAILLISEELEELMSLSDRIAVIYDGQVMGILDADEASVNEIGLMMTGTRQEDLPSQAAVRRIMARKGINQAVDARGQRAWHFLSG